MALGILQVNVTGMAGLIQAIIYVAAGYAPKQFDATYVQGGSDAYDWTTPLTDTIGGFAAWGILAVDNDICPHLVFVSDQAWTDYQDFVAWSVDRRCRATVIYNPIAGYGWASQRANLRSGAKSVIECITDVLASFTVPSLSQPWKSFAAPGNVVTPDGIYSDPDTLTGLTQNYFTYFGVNAVLNWGGSIDVSGLTQGYPAPTVMVWQFLWYEHIRISDGADFTDLPDGYAYFLDQLDTYPDGLTTDQIRLVNKLADKILLRGTKDHTVRKHKANINAKSTGWNYTLTAKDDTVQNCVQRLAEAIDGDNRRQLCLYVKGKKIVIPGGERS